MTTPSNPTVEYTKEVRFAVVMYGGVSLAIYINGVAQELLRMVRATASDGKGGARLSNDELTGSERVYRKLSHLVAQDRDEEAEPDLAAPIPTRLVVDTITGASAGGINGIFLAKALVRGQKIDRLQELWVREGAIEKLLNDRFSKDPPAVSYDNPPTALLNAKRMYIELLKAFDEMDGVTAQDPKGGKSNPLVDELDLFVTTTDLHGSVLPMRLTDEVVFERRHKNVFHFIFPRDDALFVDGDFIAETNPFLAYAARCTSSFPFAFEPMELTDIDRILDKYDNYKDRKESRSDSKLWKRFFRDYEQAAGINHVPPPQRAFADGGDLDNKPFGYAIDTLTRRHAEHPIARKLLYVEPAPDHPELDIEKDERPNVIENALDALSTLPMYETIREDLKRVDDRNRLVVRLNRVLENVDVDVEKAAAPNGTPGTNVQQAMDNYPEKLVNMSHEDWANLYLDDMVKRKGRAYVAYHRLEIASVTDDLARMVTRGAGLNEDSDYFAVNRSLARAWRGLRYVDHREDTKTESGEAIIQPLPINHFLNDFNLAYPIRRISFLRNRIEFLLCLDAAKLAETYTWRTGFQLTPARVDEFRRELRRIYSGLKKPEERVRRTGRRLMSRPKPDDVVRDLRQERHEQIATLREILIAVCAAALRKQGRDDLVPLQEDGTPDPRVVLNYFLRGTKHTVCDSPESESDSRAKELLNASRELQDQMDLIAKGISEEAKGARAFADEVSRKILGFTESIDEADANPAQMARKCLQNYYKHYDDYDMIIFPVVYETDVGEAALVDVFRVSPEDAKVLIDERATKCSKLAGVKLAHFGAFLEKRWRENDILWGRLDGAERIISSLLRIDHPQRETLIREAQAAIVDETLPDKMTDEERMNLLSEAAMRTGDGQSKPDLLVSLDPIRNPGFIDNLKKVKGPLKAKLDAKIDDQLLRRHYIKVFDEHSRPNPQSTLRTVARATTITGKIFEKLADDYVSSGKRVAAWITRVGLILWGLVELATPKSIWNLLFRYWLQLLYLVELVLIAASTILLVQTVQRIGLILFGATVAIHFAVTILSDFMQRRLKWITFVKFTAVFLLIVVVAVGVFTSIGLTLSPSIWKRMEQVNHWFNTPSPWRKWSPAIVVAILFIASIRNDLLRARNRT